MRDPKREMCIKVDYTLNDAAKQLDKSKCPNQSSNGEAKSLFIFGEHWPE